MPPQPLNDNKQGTRPRAQLELLQAPQKGSQYYEQPPRVNTGTRSHMDPSRYQYEGSQRQVATQDRDGERIQRGGNEQQMHRQPRQRMVRNPSNMVAGNSNGNAMMGSSYGMMPMGGMGYGYGGMGMGMGYGMGGMMGGMGGMMGPMNMIYSVNYFIAMIGQMTTMLGMSTQAVGQLYQMAREGLLRVEQSIRQSEMRRWLQRKSKQSPLLRCMLVLVSMLAASQVVRFLRYLIEMQMKRKGWLLGNGTPGTAAIEGLTGVGAITAATNIANGQSI